MVKRALTYVATGIGLLVALVFALCIFANVIAGVLGLIAGVPVYAAAFAVVLGGPAAVMFVFFRRRPRL